MSDAPVDGIYQTSTHSPHQTESVGERLGRLLRPGDVVLLYGKLGAGKTALARGIVRGAGSDDHVSSPTYVFIHEYSGPVPIAHADLYRLSGESDVQDLGLEEYMQRACVLLVEWPERAGGFVWPEHWVVRINVTGESSRAVEVTAPDGREAKL